MYLIKSKSKPSPSGPADRELSTSRQQTNQNRTERKTTRSLVRWKTCVALHLNVRDGRRGDTNRGTNTQNKENKEQVGGGQKRSWRLIFEFWWRRAEPIRVADWDCDHWLSSSGPVSVSMLLLSVSEASVCSVDMDEMSLADEDWEAEPDTTSDTRERRDSHDRVQWRSSPTVTWSMKEKRKRQKIMEVAAAPTWTVFFHQSVLVPFLPVDHFLINKLCRKQEMLSLCTKRTAWQNL